MAKRTVQELLASYEDPNWRKVFVDFSDLMESLGDCIIPDSYVVSDDLNNAIKLTEDGTKILTRLVKQGVNAKDARLMCALTIGFDDLFIDLQATDLGRLEAAIDDGIKRNQIRYPFIFARSLYDAYAELYEDEQEFLDNAETMKLLDRLPTGVYQYGKYTIGPYGLRTSSERRRAPASRRVPAYHCSEPGCRAIHPISLETGSNAPINLQRQKLRDILQALPGKGAEWWALAAELHGGASHYYGDQEVTVLLPLLGDALSDSELRLFVADLFDTTKGVLREAVSGFITVKDATSAVAHMNRAQLLQVTLLVDEETLATTLDRLVRSNAIEIPCGEVRLPVINRQFRSGAFRLRAELGHLGVRFVSDQPGLALLRERRLLSKLYVRDADADVQELEWQLRGFDIDDLDEKLEKFYQTKSPTEALTRLVLARRSNMITACHEVRIDHDQDMTDDEIIGTILWKLGFDVELENDPHAVFWRRHEKMSALTQSASIGSSALMGSLERFQEAAAPYFTELEHILLDSLAFTSWALLNDHTSDEKPFSYDHEQGQERGLQLLQGTLPKSEQGQEGCLDYSGKRPELYSLMQGFRILADHLEACRKTPENFERPIEDIPEFDGKTDLKRYLLRSTLPFLNLSLPSQERIITGLRSVTKTLVDASVSEVRNGYLHYRQTPPNIERVEQAVEATRQSVTKIENLGFCRLLFEFSSALVDRWGLQKHQFVGPRSFEHSFTRPTTLDWMGLPPLDEAQHLLRSASFEDPNEVLRFTRKYRSQFSEMWLGYPNRRRRGPGLPAAEEQANHQSEIEQTTN